MHMFIAIPTIGRFTQQDTHWTNANRIYGDNPQKTNEREDRLGIQTYAYVPQISAVMQSGNLYVYCMNDPVMYVDESGKAAINIVCATVGAAAGWMFGDYVANQLNLDGWKYWAVRGAVTVGGAAIGWLAGSAVTSIVKSFIIANVSLIDRIPSFVLDFLGIQKVPTTLPTGQYHHVLSNRIMDALNRHKTLSGLFDRNGSLVQALNREAHIGYQTWHREIDRIVVEWLNNPKNINATPREFWKMLYALYDTEDMINRFGMRALKYIKEMMK